MGEEVLWGAGGVAVTLVGVLGKVLVAKYRSNGHKRSGMREECAEEFKQIHGSLSQGNQKFQDGDRRLDRLEQKDDVVVKEIQTMTLTLTKAIGKVGERVAKLEGPG